jgi:TPR repeat protein
MNLVGDFFNDGSHGYPIDREQGALWYERGAALDDTNCMADLANMLLDGRLKPGDPVRGVALLERASDLGHVWATRQLADAYRDGAHGVAVDWAKAANYLERVGRLDANEAVYLSWAGDMARTGGPSLAPDLPRAAALYEAAVARGVPYAMYRLGQLLAEGQGAPRDLPRARSLLERAAQQKVKGAGEALSVLPAE